MRNLMRKFYSFLVLEAVDDEARNFPGYLSGIRVNTLLDLGTGEERYFKNSIIPLIQAVKPDKTVSIDKVHEFIKSAGKYGIKGVEADFSQGIPLVSECADMLFANQVIEHMKDLDLFMKEVRRVLKKDGTAVICTENLSSWHNIFSLFFGWQPFSLANISYVQSVGNPFSASEKYLDSEGKEYRQEIKEVYIHHKVFAYRALADLFRVYGFKTVRILGTGYYPLFGPLARLLARIDPRHAGHITIIARK
jgi:SAM-dependent methyltransferase